MFNSTVELHGVQFECALILKALYDHSVPYGMGMLHYEPGDMDLEEARELLKDNYYFDYLKGRVLKWNAREPFNFRLYDRDNGVDAGINALLNLLTNP